MGYVSDSVSLTEVYARGNVTHSGFGTGISVGGLIGKLSEGSTLLDCFSHGTVFTTTTEAGGLIGAHADNGTGITTFITNCYATGEVTATSEKGGFIGYETSGIDNPPIITGSFWDIQTSGLNTSFYSTGGAEGKTTITMQSQSNYIGWDFTDTWNMGSTSYPELMTTPVEPLVE